MRCRGPHASPFHAMSRHRISSVHQSIHPTVLCAQVITFSNAKIPNNESTWGRDFFFSCTIKTLIYRIVLLFMAHRVARVLHAYHISIPSFIKVPRISHIHSCLSQNARWVIQRRSQQGNHSWPQFGRVTAVVRQRFANQFQCLQRKHLRCHTFVWISCGVRSEDSSHQSESVWQLCDD